jgi:hypothetical protein
MRENGTYSTHQRRIEMDQTQESLEQGLMRELRFGGIDKENLKELVGIVATLHKGGLKKVKVFPKGIPVVDGLRVSGILEAGEVGRFVSEILVKTPRLGPVYGFPYGIPWPELFRVNIDLGATSVSSDPMPGLR